MKIKPKLPPRYAATETKIDESKPVDAGAFYEAHIDDEAEYVRIAVASPVAKGDTMRSDIGISIITRVKENGYVISEYRDYHDKQEQFFSADEFAEDFTPVDDYPLAAPTEDLSEGTTLKVVSKGDQMIVGTDIKLMAIAPTDGVVMETNEGTAFVSNFVLTSIFNHSAKLRHTNPDIIVTPKDAPAVKGVLLEKPVTFAFKEGDYAAEAGSILFVNPEDEDGYTLCKPGRVSLGFRAKPKA